MRRALRAVYAFSIFVRFTALGFSVVLPLLGAATVAAAAASIASRRILGLLGVAIAFHFFAYVFNDVIDLSVDRTEPRRAQYPLVRGTIPRWLALCFAFSQIPIAYWISSRLQSGIASHVTLAAAFALMAAYNIWGKRVRFPILTDAIQGVAWSCLILFGALATSGSINRLTILLAAFETVYIVMINGVHGALRDLENDRRHDILTTAAMLGARIRAHELVISALLARYATALQTALTVMAILASLITGSVATVVAVSTVSLTSIWLLRIALASGKDREGLLAAGMLHLIISFTPAIVLFSLHTDHKLIGVIAIAYLIPLFAHEWLYDAMRWVLKLRLPQQVCGVVEIMRLHNCLAAMLTTLLGAYLAGGFAALQSSVVWTVMASLALVVAACNVINDHRDATNDSFSHPFRPIPSGRISPRGAELLAIFFAVAAAAVALGVSTRWGLIVSVFLILGVSYSFYFKSTILIGNVLIGLLSGGLVLAGAFATDVVVMPAVLVSILVFIFMSAYEVLNSLEDRESDTRARLNTVATRLQKTTALRVFQILELIFVLAALAPWFLSLAPDRYLYVLLPCSILPTFAVVTNLSFWATDDSIRLSRQVLKIVWFSSLLPMTMMR